MNDYLVIWNGSHQNRDCDLFRPVEWDQQKEKPLTLKGGRSACAPPKSRRKPVEPAQGDRCPSL